MLADARERSTCAVVGPSCRGLDGEAVASSNESTGESLQETPMGMALGRTANRLVEDA